MQMKFKGVTCVPSKSASQGKFQTQEKRVIHQAYFAIRFELQSLVIEQKESQGEREFELTLACVGGWTQAKLT